MVPNADETQRLLDNGWSIVLTRNYEGQYVAWYVRNGEDVKAALLQGTRFAVDTTPTQALHRLAELHLGHRLAEDVWDSQGDPL